MRRGELRVFLLPHLGPSSVSGDQKYKMGLNELLLLVQRRICFPTAHIFCLVTPSPNLKAKNGNLSLF